MLNKFLKIYTWIVSVLVVFIAGIAIYSWMTGQMLKAYYFAFTGLLFIFIYFITRWFVKRNLQK